MAVHVEMAGEGPVGCLWKPAEHGPRAKLVTCFRKQRLLQTVPIPFGCVLSGTAFVLQGQTGVVAKEISWPASPKHR